MQNTNQNQDIIIYQTKDGESKIEVNLKEETVWLNQRQMSNLFDKDVRTINEHIKNIYKEKELTTDSTIRKFRIVQSEGKREIEREIEFYNLDVIISVGYRVKSLRGTQFRIWATNVLKQHLIQGYTVNEKRLQEQKNKFIELLSTIKLLERTISAQPVQLPEAKELIKVVSDYGYALSLLDEYDHQKVTLQKTTTAVAERIDYEEVIKIIEVMKDEFSSPLFGKTKDESFQSSLNTIYQTYGGVDLYPSIEEKAANLLYFIVKNHSFIDGNKRIAAAIFLYFLCKNGILYHADGTKRLADNTLVALTLMIAESKPAEKEVICKVAVRVMGEN